MQTDACDDTCANMQTLNDIFAIALYFSHSGVSKAAWPKPETPLDSLSNYLLTVCVMYVHVYTHVCMHI